MTQDELNVLISPAVAFDSAVDSVIFAVGVAWAPAVVIVSAVSGVSAAAVVLTAVDVPRVPALARVSAVAAAPSLLTSHLLQVFPTFLGPFC
jgi:prophage DNA circulation protein